MPATLDFRCPNCGHATRVTAEYCGQTGPCAGCGSTIAIPRTTGEPAPKGEASILGRTILLLLFSSIALLIGAVLAMSGLKLLEPAARGLVVAANQRESKGNLAKIATALLAYQQKYGSFPPAAVRDGKGKALHSWRVLILPFLGPAENSLYDEYHFDEPWDGLSNTSLHHRMPAVFASSRDTSRGAGEGNYFVVYGKRTLISAGRSEKREGPIGNPADLVLVVEALNQTGSSWLEPRDFAASALHGQINGGAAGQLNGVHEDGIYVVTGSGEPRFVSASASAEELRALGLIED